MNEETAILYFGAETEDAGKRLDAFLAEKIEGWSRSRLQKLIDAGECLVNEKRAKSSYKLRGGEAIEIELAETLLETIEPENIPLKIVYEDESLAVINKKAGMVVHPGAGVSSGTLANAIAWHFKFQISDSKFENESIRNPKSEIRNRIGIVHRLDKDTSGLIVVAKDETTHEALSAQFREREVYKSYVALVHGVVKDESGKISEKIGRDRWHRTRMDVSKNGRDALSIWKIRQRFEKFTLLDVQIKTGRTHQIRVHLSFINHPIVGDEIYNSGRDKTVSDMKIRQAIADLNRFFLHAEKLAFTHPQTKERLSFVAPLPKELTDFLELL